MIYVFTLQTLDGARPYIFLDDMRQRTRANYFEYLISYNSAGSTIPGLSRVRVYLLKVKFFGEDIDVTS
jgi:hypothetical protein